LTRVLFLTESFHPVLGGGENHIRLLADRLAKRGMAVTVLTRRGSKAWARDEMLGGVRVLRVPPPGGGRLGKYLMVPAALAGLVRHRAEYDLVVVRGGRVLGLPGVLLARLLGLGAVLQPEVTGELSGEVYLWGTALDTPLVRRLLGIPLALRNRLLRRADAFVAISRPIRDEIVAAGVPLERVELIPHGVDTQLFRPAAEGERRRLRESLAWPQDARVLVFTGRLLRGKGLEVLFEAFRSVLDTHKDARLVLVGSGEGQALSVEGDLRRAAAEEPLASRVKFAGRVDNVQDYLRAADLFVFPSLFEAMPLSVIEAASCGLASVASRVGGIPDVLEDDRAGGHVAPNDAHGLAEAVTALLEDEERRKRLGSAARERVLGLFDLETSLGRYERLFSSLAEPAAR